MVSSVATGLLRFVFSHPENDGRRLRAIARLAGWQVWERVVKRPWTISLQGDLRLRCYPHSTAATGVLYCQLPEWEDMRFLRDFLRPGDVFIDVGANVGVYSLLAAGIPGVDVWAFEPSSEAAGRLRENVALNSLGSTVTVVQAAVGAGAEKAELTTGKDTVNRFASSQEDGEGRTEPVEVVALDDAIASETWALVRLLKVDVEGFEELVLKGSERVLETAGPVLIIEANDPAALASLLAPIGYRPYTYDPRAKRLGESAWSGGHGNNVIAVRNAELVEARLAERRTS